VLAGALHLAASLFLGLLAHLVGMEAALELGAAFPTGAASLIALWGFLYALMSARGGFSGHLRAPRASLLRLDEHRWHTARPVSLVALEGLAPCVLPLPLYAAAAPGGIPASLGAAALFSLVVTGVTLAKLLLLKRRPPDHLVGALGRHGDLLAGIWLLVASPLILL
jgi:hypothetical protein